MVGQHCTIVYKLGNPHFVELSSIDYRGKQSKTERVAN